MRGERTAFTHQSLNQFVHLLVGRAAELVQIADLVEAALAGSGRILRLEGAVM